MSTEQQQESKKPQFIIGDFRYSFQRTHFRKHHVITGITKYIGRKPVEDEVLHSEVIGKNRSICKKLYMLGAMLVKSIGYDMGFGIYDNHVWLPQTDEGDTKNKGFIIHVCLNCGSVMAHQEFVGNFTSETDTDFDAKTFKGVKE